jgi:predicted O-methyltransferase YrrM
LAKIQKPRQILEIGTLGGYSTAWLAQALLPQGRLISLEINPYHAEKAHQHLQEFKEKKIEIRTGHAVELLAQLDAAQEGPFDLIFIDADKENNALYLDWSLRLSRSGTLILIDNLIPKGKKIGYPSHEEAKVIYAFNDYLAQHPLLEIAALPTLVAEGRLDALAIAYVKK